MDKDTQDCILDQYAKPLIDGEPVTVQGEPLKIRVLGRGRWRCLDASRLKVILRSLPRVVEVEYWGASPPKEAELNAWAEGPGYDSYDYRVWNEI